MLGCQQSQGAFQKFSPKGMILLTAENHVSSEKDKIGQVAVQEIEIPATLPLTVQANQSAKLKMGISRNPMQPGEERSLSACIAAPIVLIRQRRYPSCLLLPSAWCLHFLSPRVRKFRVWGWIMWKCKLSSKTPIARCQLRGRTPSGPFGIQYWV